MAYTVYSSPMPSFQTSNVCFFPKRVHVHLMIMSYTICTVTINTVLALVFDIAIQMYIACMMIEDQELRN